MTSSRGLRAQVESLLADELWDSAETLGGLLASHAQSRHADAEGVPAGEPSGPGVPGGRVPIGVGVSASLCPPASGARRLSSSALA